MAFELILVRTDPYTCQLRDSATLHNSFVYQLCRASGALDHGLQRWKTLARDCCGVDRFLYPTIGSIYGKGVIAARALI